ncbi:MAG: YggT family protein [Micrococcales bacterium]|nr:YggT family protein [Micrococcales bacterium]
MSILFAVLYVVTLVYVLVLFVRLIFDWVQVFSRQWRPTGPLLVVAEIVYTVTDPPLKALRKVLPTVNVGQFRFDLGFLVLMLGCFVLLNVFAWLAGP